MVFSMFGFAAMLESAFDWIELRLIKHHQVVEMKMKKRERRRLLKQQTLNQPAPSVSKDIKSIPYLSDKL